jgi:hypothetical protein
VSAGCRKRSVAVSRAGIAGSCACCEVATILETSGVRELSWASNVALFSGKFDCKLEVICGDVKEISGTEPCVNNLEPGVISSTCDVGDVGDLAEDIKGSAGRVSLETGTGEDDDGMPGTFEGGSTPKSVLYSRSTAPLDGSDGEIAVEATMAGRVSDSEWSVGEITGASA